MSTIRPAIPATLGVMIGALMWGDGFAGSGAVDADRWRFEDMVGDDQHRTIREDGPGHRWAARYDRHHEELARRENGHLVMRSKVTDEPNPRRVNFTADDGVHEPYADHTLYTAWIDTCGRDYSPVTKTQMPTHPGITFKPGCLMAIRVSFEHMSVRGARFSGWTMPAAPNDGNAYKKDPKRGAEIDLFEYDAAQPHLLQCKVIGGDKATQTPNGSIDARKFGIDLTKGFHTIAILWLTDRIVWLLDGVAVLEDLKNVPLVAQYLILSQEINSGNKDERAGIPKDVGLYAVSAIRDRAKFATHRVLVDWVGVWDVTPAGVQPSIDRPVARPAQPKPAAPAVLTGWRARLAALRERRASAARRARSVIERFRR